MPRVGRGAAEHPYSVAYFGNMQQVKKKSTTVEDYLVECEKLVKEGFATLLPFDGSSIPRYELTELGRRVMIAEISKPIGSA